MRKGERVGEVFLEDLSSRRLPRKTSGEDVGLPAGVMGNSEVGHQNIGAGRIVNQEVMRITSAIRDGSFFENGVLQEAVDCTRWWIVLAVCLGQPLAF